MVKSVATAQLHQEEEDDDDYEDKGETLKVEGKGSDQKTTANRSKHSETEQRRRSKINERFQTLRDLIPQNDQKRDKASFLLEVIEYIQFLQEKLQMYEGSYQAWSQEPTKLIPWRNNHGLAESFIDHSQVMKNGSSFFKALDHPPVSATSMINMQTQSNTFANHGSGSGSMNMVYQPQFQSWQSRECLTESAVPNNSANERDDLTTRVESVGFSSAYSQGILNSLTQALQSSGMDMSQASISVQIDVGKRVASGVTSMASSSKEKEIQFTTNQVIAQTGVHSYTEESD
ncbi:transcription factor BIM2-like isoform X2 [Durio zibethinus]|uniref:Transcription factor BIM2-like isoform X2 n=1 Tax=Durio zibethinus TaxID=66656 RepID=A0A6P6A2E3_DURZI|nr:transcription factor BIM2-like isoform X2 [Durio zibethinus]